MTQPAMEEPEPVAAAPPKDTLSSNPSALLFFPSRQFSSRYGDQFFTAQVDSFKVVNGETPSWLNVLLCLPATQYVTYAIHVKWGKNAWTVSRRYSDFAKIFGKDPSFPSKTLFPLFSESHLKIRQEQLNSFLSQHLEKACKLSGDFMNNEDILDFLSFPRHEYEWGVSSGITAADISTTSPSTSTKKEPMVQESTVHHDNVSEELKTFDIDSQLEDRYSLLLKEVEELRSKRDNLYKAIKEEQISHELSKHTVEDLQSRIDEELVSYSHAKAFIEDLQIRLDDELAAQAVAKEEIEDLQQRLDEVISANQSQEENEILTQRVSDLQKRIDEEISSYMYAKSFVEDLQNRIDEVLSSIEGLKLQEIEIQSKIDVEISSNNELKRRLELVGSKAGPPSNLNEVRLEDPVPNIKELNNDVVAPVIENPQLSTEIEDQPVSHLNVESIPDTVEQTATSNPVKINNNKSADGHSSASKVPRRNPKKKKT